MQLNEAQQLAVSHVRGPMLVLAGPGSGKTAVITNRVRELTRNHHIPPEKILVITFSRAAATEMKKRYEAMSDGNASQVSFGTFHAIFFKIVKDNSNYNNSSIITEEDKYRILRDSVRKHNIVTDNERELIEKLAGGISALKSESVRPEEFRVAMCTAEEFERVRKDYLEYLISERKLDFDDMMIMCRELFRSKPAELKRWQERYGYILIDEFQDINAMQYELVKMLAAPENNIFAVGDDDQSVYGFRGAHPGIMFDFEKDFKDCKRVLLNVNYRCRSEILEVAGRLISVNRSRFQKKLVSAKGKGGRVEYHRFAGMEDENEFVAAYLRERMETGRKLCNVAVLYRMNREAKSLFRTLSLKNIPCRMRESIPCIFDHWIAEDMLEYIKMARGEWSRGGALKVINRPKRYVTRESVQRAFELLNRENGDLLSTEKYIRALTEANKDKGYVVTELTRLERQLEILRKLDPLASVKFLRMAVGYDSYLKEFAKEHGASEDELFELLEELEDSARGYETIDEWLESMTQYRQKLAELRAKQRNGVAGRNDAENDAVELMTFHTAKGLEFDTVFIIDVLEGSCPQKRAETEAEIEEERRAFYVAMTRAREELYILNSRDRLGRELAVSRFIGDAGLKESK